MFHLMDVVQIGVIIFAAAGVIISTRKDVKFLKNRIEYWFGTGNVSGKDDPDHNEGLGIIKLKKYIQGELTRLDNRNEQRFIQNEARIAEIERVIGIKYKLNGTRNGNRNGNRNGLDKEDNNYKEQKNRNNKNKLR